MPIDLTPYVKITSIRRRFFSKIKFCQHSKSCGECCWLWTKGTYRRGYGNFYVCKALRATASRFMWTLVYGHTDLHVLHSCDMPACVNYNHMFTGTDKENAEDRDRKGRRQAPIGESNPNVKITPDTIWHIRTMRESGFTYRTIGLIVGISGSQVRLILTGKRWKHLHKQTRIV